MKSFGLPQRSVKQFSCFILLGQGYWGNLSNALLLIKPLNSEKQIPEVF